jgi:hypothetical protein
MADGQKCGHVMALDDMMVTRRNETLPDEAASATEIRVSCIFLFSSGLTDYVLCSIGPKYRV